MKYETRPFPLIRRLVIDSAAVGHGKRFMHGLIEVDVTEPRRRIHDIKARTGESISFTAFIIACLGRAIGEDPSVQAYSNWRNRLIVFEDVDITSLIQIEVEGQKFPLAHVFRAANHKTVRQIHDEIRAIQHNPQPEVGSRVQRRALKAYLLLPGFVRRLFYRALDLNPVWRKKTIGTVILTSVGMFGKGSGWGIFEPPYNLGVVLGGIAEKPGVVEGRIEIREYLDVTISFVHDTIDGGPMVQFMQRFKELIESGCGLEDS